MRRRALLRGGLFGLVTLGGCGSVTDDSGDTSTRTSTATTTSTRTEEATTTTERPLYRPGVVDAHLVSTWAERGDLTANRVESVVQGTPAVVAFRYAVRLPEGTFEFREEVEVHGPDGTRLARQRVEVTHRTPEAGTHEWEHAMAFDTGKWPPGECVATVTVGNLELHGVSDPVSTAFRVTR